MAFAPSSGISKSAQGLASSSRWVSLESDGKLIWGECKSSRGTAHYKTVVDLKGPAFKCSCPSRAFPCKHSLALLLLLAKDNEAFRIPGEVPEEVTAWYNKRHKGESQEKKERTPEEIQKSEAAKEKKQQERFKRMAEGIDDLEKWLVDLIRTGLAAMDKRSDEFTSSGINFSDGPPEEQWKNFSKRMVDAQLPGIARKIRETELLKGTTADWPAKVLANLSEIHLASRGFRQLDRLPAELQSELLTYVGKNIRKQDVLQSEGIQDEWMVVGKFEHFNVDNATVRRTWFKGLESDTCALVLEYDYQREGLPTLFPPGRIFKGEISFYPSSFPIRGLIKEPEIVKEQISSFHGHPNIGSFLRQYAGALKANPWLPDFPTVLDRVVPIFHEDKWWLMDEYNEAIPISGMENIGWKISALSGGNPIEVFGEWTGETLLPLSVVSDDRFINLH